jgi:hypothetical protein
MDKTKQSKLLGWALVALLTSFNFKLFMSRWAEEPRAPFHALLSNGQISALVVGICAVGILFAFLDTIRSLRVGALVSLVGISALFLGLIMILRLDSAVRHPLTNFFGIGVALGALLFKLRDGSPGSQEPKTLTSFSLMTLASFNVFMLIAPWTSHVPSYMQDRFRGMPGLSDFYFGSVHSDLSPVSTIMRWVINLFFDYPSINATAFSSMFYVAVGLALAGVAIEIIFGSYWGWALLFLAWTDRWLFASAVSSGIIGQPVLATAHALLLCAWALWRKSQPLSWKEALILGLVNLFGFFFNFYGYSAARMAWLVGSGVAALILIFRRAVWFNFDGLRKVTVALLPSVALIVAIWVSVFRMDSAQFASRLFISPGVDFQVKDLNSYRTKLIAVSDPDMPIWWGTARPIDGENKSLYWRRTPKELYEKVKSVMAEVAMQNPIALILILLGGAGMAVGASSALASRRWFSLSLLIITSASFLTFILAQDSSAYRRSLATNMLLMVGAVSFFAVRIRGRLTKFLAIACCGVLAVLRAPSELNALFDESFWSQACVNCQPSIDVRILVNDPAFGSLSQRPIKYMVEGPGISPVFGRCARLAFESHEFKKVAPQSSELVLGAKTLSQAFSELEGNQVLLVACFRGSNSDPEFASVCSGAAKFGVPLATIPPERKEQERMWWAVVSRGAN